MILEELTKDGKKRLVERVMFGHCLICGAEQVCPPNAEPWIWAKSEGAAFLSEHLRHAPPRAVGLEVKFVEKE